MKTLAYLLFLLSIAACQNDKRIEKDDALDKNEITSVNDTSFISLNGEKQYVEITGTSSQNPVLLFIHGGPGWPQTPHLRYFNADLTKSVILVSWEQSGSGKSFQ